MKLDLIEVIVVLLLASLTILTAANLLTNEQRSGSITVYNATIIIPSEGKYTFNGTLRLTE